jgi:hypothetical protein
MISLFDIYFIYGDGANGWGYVGTNTYPLYIEFCNSVQYHIFVNYLTS